ncbi:MAG: type II toxin-antitoxin system RelE/ParE family toxin [Fimbriimonadaceae bacterium]
MTYRVRVTGPARKDIKRQTRYIAVERQEPVSAERWREGVIGAITALGEFPRSHPKVPEGEGLDADVRVLVFLSHRILFGIDDESKTVTVYRVLHGASLSDGLQLDL